VPWNPEWARLVINVNETEKVVIQCSGTVRQSLTPTHREMKNGVIINPFLDGRYVQVYENVNCCVGDVTLHATRGSETERKGVVDPKEAFESHH
jgi:hypothetical protein